MCFSLNASHVCSCCVIKWRDVFPSIVRGLAGFGEMRRGMKGDWTQCWWRRCELCIHGVFSQRKRGEWRNRRGKDWVEELRAYFISRFTRPKRGKEQNTLKLTDSLFFFLFPVILFFTRQWRITMNYFAFFSKCHMFASFVCLFALFGDCYHSCFTYKSYHGSMWDWGYVYVPDA